MEDKNKSALITVNDKYAVVAEGTEALNKESLGLINKIIAESDLEKSKDLTYLFNINQNKKTLIRVNKLSDLLDTMTQQALIRFTTKPDEISNKELMDGLKIIQDLIERGQRQTAGVNDVSQPLIQINQQTNSVNIGGDGNETQLSRDSRERVKNAVLDLLNGITKQNSSTNIETTDFIDISKQNDDIIEAEIMEETNNNE